MNLINTFTYTQEQIIRTAKKKLKISEVPIHTRKTRESKLFKNPFDYALKAWINILRIYRDYNPLGFFLRIGFFFLLCGLILGSWLVYLFLAHGAIRRTPSLILTILLVIVGIQIILFGFLADMKKQ